MNRGIRNAARRATPLESAGRWARRGVRFVVVAFLVLAATYATFPYWLPRGEWLRQRVIEDLSRSLGAPVHIGELEISWSRGVQVRSIRISDAVAPSQPLVSVDEVRLGLNPIGLLLGHGFERADFVRPAVTVRIDPGGRLNLGQLEPKLDGELPTRRWSIEDARVAVIDERHATRFDLRLADISIEIEPRTGRTAVRLDGELIQAIASRSTAGAIGGDATLTIPNMIDGGATNAEARAEAAPEPLLNGRGSLHWDGIDLATLPIRMIPGLHEAELTGRWSGQIRGTLTDDLQQRWRFETRVSKLHYRARRSEPFWQLGDASLSGEGHWDPTADRVECSEFEFQMPGLTLRGCGPWAPDASDQRGEASAFVWALNGDTRFSCGLCGEVEDMKRLLRWLPPKVARAVAPDEAQIATAGGAFGFKLHWRSGPALTEAAVRVEGRGLTLGAGWPIRLDGRVPVELSARAALDGASRILAISDTRIVLGGTRAMVTARIPWEDGALGGDRVAGRWLQACWRRGEGSIGLESNDAAEALAIIPALDWRSPGMVLSGPLRAAFDFHGAPGGSRIRMTGTMSNRTVCRAPPWFEKSPGRELSWSVEAADVERPDGLFPDLVARLRYGTAEVVANRLPDSDELGGAFRVAIQRRAADAASTGDSVTASGSELAPEYTIDSAVRMAVSIRESEHLAELFPALLMSDAANGAVSRVPLVQGNGTARLEGNLRHSVSGRVMQPELWRVSATIDARDFRINVPDRFDKRRGDKAECIVNYWFDRRSARDVHRLAAVVRTQAANLDTTLDLGGGRQRLTVDCRVDDAQAIAAVSPALRPVVEAHQVRGGVRLLAELARTPYDEDRSFQLDLTDLAFASSPSSGPDAWSKPRGVPCSLDVRLRSRHDDRGVEAAAGDAGEASGLELWRIDRFDAVLAGCRLRAPGGRLELMPDALTRLNRAPGSGDSVLGGAIRAVELDAEASLILDSTLLALSPGLERLVEEFDALGHCTARCTVRGGAAGLRFNGRADTTRLNFRVPGVLTKPAGMAATLDWDVETVVDHTRAAGPGALRAMVHELAGAVGGVNVRASGTVRWQGPGDGEDGGGLLSELEARLRTEVACADLSAVPESFGPIRVTDETTLRPVSGGLEARFGLTWEGGRARFDSAEARFRGARWLVERPKHEPLSFDLDGAAALSDRTVESRGLAVRCDGLDGTFAAMLEWLDDRPRGTVMLSARALDLPRLRARVEEVLPRGDGSPEPTIRAAMRAMSESDVRAVIHCRDAVMFGLTGGEPFRPSELSIDVRAVESKLSTSFHAAVNGGVVTGLFEVPLHEEDPYFDLAYEARRLSPAPNTRPIVEAFFPGMEVSGRVTLIDRSHQRLFGRPGEQDFPTGHGEMIVEGGTIRGRAAPLWVTRIFPRLNLAEFEFTRMENRFEKLRDGRQNNSMTFFGNYYHLYVEGFTTADARAEYEVGVDLLARVSPDLSRIGQGRVALFNKTGRIREGKMEDEVVSYLTPGQVSQKILTNNLVTISYYALKKQVTGL
ncbi:MAG: hypothetical protein L6Q92_02955 [Phycisphaerae bacterium]|nr:hypothetical protein [Phycisphaerae bacterium]